jgi:NarL family two-component system response regulator LiaR
MVNAKKYRVVVVEDHALTRAGLRTALSADPQIEVVGEANDGLAGFSIIEHERPDVAVVDIGLPGIDGIELTRRVHGSFPGTHVLILTMHDQEREVLAALAAGADAYCVKSSESKNLISAVRTVGEGGAYFDARIADVVLRSLASAKPPPLRKDSPLTPGELQILRLIADGRGNQEIADQLHLASGTVKSHVHDILNKLSVSGRAQAAMQGLRQGFLQ